MWVYESVYALIINTPAQNNAINPKASMRNIPITIQLGMYDAIQTHNEAAAIGTTITRKYRGVAFLRSVKNDLLFSHFCDILLKYSMSNNFMK